MDKLLNQVVGIFLQIGLPTLQKMKALPPLQAPEFQIHHKKQGGA